jgi:hypothetical protein
MGEVKVHEEQTAMVNRDTVLETNSFTMGK